MTTRKTMPCFVIDQILRAIQQRCEHPGNMVAADLLEGDGRTFTVSYCRRCGAIRLDHQSWRLPDPNLWRGR